MAGRRLLGFLAVAAVLVAGCSRAGAHPKAAAAAEPTRSRPPAGAAGGACQLLDYDLVARILGVTFDVAAASQNASTFSCVLQARGASYPDLVLTVTPTKVNQKAFRTAVMPKGATAVADLGKVGYSAPAPPLGAAGPGVEVGWLSVNGRLIVLRYRLPSGAAPEMVAALTPKLVLLAMEVDAGSR